MLPSPPATTFAPRWTQLLAWLLLLIFPIYSSFILFTGLWTTSKSVNWAQTTGRVVEHSIRGRGSCFTPYIRYDYTVNAIEFTSDKRVLGLEECFSRENADRMVDALPIGSAIRVYYDQVSPVKSVLLPGHITRNAWLGIFVLPVLLCGWLWVGKLLLQGHTREPRSLNLTSRIHGSLKN